MKDKRELSPIAVSLGLAVLTFFVFLPVLWCDFVEYDDEVYVTNNWSVLGGLTWQSALWAFTNLEAGFWHPLTWLSHMLDVEIYGLRPWGHHLTNLLLHMANTVLLFSVLRRMTGALWRSAMVAGLFALHPLHVESVAWVAERKDVLSTLFAFLSLLFYVRYVSESKVQSPRSKVDYGLAVGMFACGLMSKTMVVTLPVVMLLLDYWPLQRGSGFKVQGSRLEVEDAQSKRPGSRPSTPDSRLLWRFVWEKSPFFVMSGVTGALTIFAEQSAGALPLAANYPIAVRFANAAVSAARYLEQLVWPENMTAFYPYLKGFSGWTVIYGGLLLVLISAAALALWRRQPYWGVGSLWYLVTLLPVIGLIQVGEHSRADRYTYVPLIGVFIALVWGGYEVLARWRMPKALMGIMAILVLGACAGGTLEQLRYWRNTESLFRHLVAVTKNNYAVYRRRGLELADKKKFDETIETFQAVIGIEPSHVGMHINLGNALAARGKFDEAIKHYRQALRIAPNNPRAHCSLAHALAAQHKYDEAIEHYTEALRIAPRYARAHNNLGSVLAELGHLDAAVRHYNEALQIDPTYADAHLKLGTALAQLGRREEAVMHLREALRLKPNNEEAKSKLRALEAETQK